MTLDWRMVKFAVFTLATVIVVAISVIGGTSPKNDQTDESPPTPSVPANAQRPENAGQNPDTPQKNRKEKDALERSPKDRNVTSKRVESPPRESNDSDRQATHFVKPPVSNPNIKSSKTALNYEEDSIDQQPSRSSTITVHEIEEDPWVHSRSLRDQDISSTFPLPGQNPRNWQQEIEMSKNLDFHKIENRDPAQAHKDMKLSSNVAQPSNKHNRTATSVSESISSTTSTTDYIGDSKSSGRKGRVEIEQRISDVLQNASLVLPSDSNTHRRNHNPGDSGSSSLCPPSSGLLFPLRGMEIACYTVVWPKQDLTRLNTDQRKFDGNSRSKVDFLINEHNDKEELQDTVSRQKVDTLPHNVEGPLILDPSNATVSLQDPLLALVPLQDDHALIRTSTPKPADSPSPSSTTIPVVENIRESDCQLVKLPPETLDTLTNEKGGKDDKCPHNTSEVPANAGCDSASSLSDLLGGPTYQRSCDSNASQNITKNFSVVVSDPSSTSNVMIEPTEFFTPSQPATPRPHELRLSLHTNSRIGGDSITTLSTPNSPASPVFSDREGSGSDYVNLGSGLVSPIRSDDSWSDVDEAEFLTPNSSTSSLEDSALRVHSVISSLSASLASIAYDSEAGSPVSFHTVTQTAAEPHSSSPMRVDTESNFRRTTHSLPSILTVLSSTTVTQTEQDELGCDDSGHSDATSDSEFSDSDFFSPDLDDRPPSPIDHV